MKNKIFPFFINILFLFIFIIFYKGLKNSNIYVPNYNFEKKFKSFTAIYLIRKKEINSDEIFIEMINFIY